MPDERPTQPGLRDLAACRTRGDFGQLLTQLRNSAGLSIRQVQVATKIPTATLGDYFKGTHLPPARDRTLGRIVAACGVGAGDLAAAWETTLERVRLAPGRPPANAPAPYRGLDFFRTEDADWFFGRERLTALLTGRAASQRRRGVPLVVVGPSGAGKSSLLRAGLIPALGPGAETLLLTPGPRPLETLAAQAGTLAGNPGLALIVDQFEEVFAPGVSEDDRQAFIEAVCAAAEPAGGAATLVVLGLRADFYARAFADPRLVRFLQDDQIVVGPMTEDELRRAIAEPARKARLDLEPGLVDLLMRDIRPVSARVGSHDPGALPLLSHALLATWRERRSGRLTIAGYQASGGIEDAVARSADAAFAELDEEQQRAARRLFLRLVWVSDDMADTRRRVSLDELGAPWTDHNAAGADDATRAVLALFVARRLITSDATTAEITHEALLTAWPQLRRWIDESRAGLVLQRRITAAARAWKDAGCDDGELLRGGRLALARPWATDPARRADLSPVERDFVDASVARATAEQDEQRRHTRRIRRLAGALAVALLLTAALSGYALQQRASVSSQRDQAASLAVAVEAAELRSQDPTLAAQLSLAAYRIAPTAPARASLLNSSASPLAARLLGPSDSVQSVALSPDHQLLAEAAADGTVRLWSVTDPDRPHSLGAPFVRPGEAVYAAAFSPSGTILAVAGASGQVQLWNVARPARPAPMGRPLRGLAGTVYALAFSPDGCTLAAGSADGTVRLWKLSADRPPAQGSPAATLRSTDGSPVQSVAFSPDGSTLAAGTAGGTVLRWSLVAAGRRGSSRSAPVALTALSGPGGPVYSVAFSPDGRTLAAGSKDKTVWVWNVAQRTRPRLVIQLKGATSWINAVAFSPDGTMLADGSSDDTAQIWNLATRSAIATLAHPGPVTTVAWDGGHTLITGAADGSVRLWSVMPPALASDGVVNGVAFSHHQPVLAVASADLRLWNPASHAPLSRPVTVPGATPEAVAISPAGPTLAAGYSDGLARLYRVTAGGSLASDGAPLRATAAGYDETVAFSPDGHVLATGGDDGTVRLWNVTDPARPRRLATVGGFTSYVFSVAFSANGDLLAAGSADKTVRLWHISDPAHPVLLGGPLTGPANTVYSVAFSPHGHILAAGSADRSVRLWDISDPARPRQLGVPLTGPASYVYAIAFSPSGTTLAAGSTDDTVWLWDMTNPRAPAVLATLTGPQNYVYAVAFSRDGRTLAAGSADGTVRLWDLAPTAAAAAVCTMTGQPTRAEWARYVPGFGYAPPCGDG